jgi:phytol kinase
MERLAEHRDQLLVVASFAWIAVVIGVGESARRLTGASPDLTRKIVHIGVGSWALPTALYFHSPGWAAFCPLTFVLLNALSYYYRLMPVIEVEGRGSPGTIYFPLVFAGLILILWPHGARAASVAGLYAMGFGDAAASIVGQRWGRHRYRIAGATKSWEGSLAFFIVSFVAIYLGTRLLSPHPSIWLPSLGAALLATLAEAPAGHGLDNLTVPVTAAFVYWGLESLGT